MKKTSKKLNEVKKEKKDVTYVNYALPFTFGAKSKKLYQPVYDDTLLQPDRTFWYNDNYDRF
jgi:hypothetical protein